MSRLALFYIAAAVAAAIFLLGVVANLTFWLSGVPPGERGRRLRGFVAFTFSPRGLWLLFFLGLVQAHLFTESRLRWAMSVALAWGALELFFVGSLGNMGQEYGVFSLSKDEPWFALLNDIGGALLLVGVALAALRRYVIRERQLPFAWDDGVILVWLAVAGLSGFVAEAGRLLAQGVAGEVAGYSFIGNALAKELRGLGLTGAAEPYLWWTHAAVSLGLLAYLPYSKLFHIFVSPLSLLARGRTVTRKEDYVLS